jgi:hypothetical protein
MTEEGREYASLATDGAGRFSFENVAPGTYRLLATREGYVSAEFGQRHPDRPGQPLTLADGQHRTDIALAMTPTGVISGRVRDIYGEPVVNARVEALGYRYQNGRRVLTRVQTATTNDLGEYRLFWMQPGDYVVRTAGTQASGGALRLGDNVVQLQLDATRIVTGVTSVAGVRTWSVEGGGGPGAAFAPVYYPGTSDPAQAVAIGLRAGSEFPGIDLLQTGDAMTTVRGRVIAPGGSAPAQRALVRIVPRADVLVEGETERSVRAAKDGTFEIPNLLPGTYDLTATLNGTAGVFGAATLNAQLVERVLEEQALQAEVEALRRRVQAIAELDEDAPPALFARASLDVRAGSGLIENLVLELTPGLALNGRVSLPPGEAPDLSALRVQLPEDRALFGVTPTAQVAEDGTFTLTDLPPADYRGVRVTGLPAGSHIEAARLGALKALDSPFTLGARSAGVLDLRLASTPGALEIAAVGQSGERLADMTVVLVPDPARRGREDLYRVQPSDGNALVRFEHIPPGDYKVFAWDRVPQGAWQNPGFIRQHETAGVPVRIPAGGSESALVTVIR